MPVPSVMSDLSTTAASNSPAGTEAPTNADDHLRAAYAILRTTNAKGSDIASASTTDIGAATAEFVDVTGTTTITALGTIAAGIERTVRFTGALTLTHNATSLILPGAANITTVANDTAIFRSLGSGNWLCVSYKTATGYAARALNADITGLSLASNYGLGDIKNAAFTVTLSGNAATIALKTQAGTDPSATDVSQITFRNATLTSGAWTKRTVTAALSTVISSGSTGGTTSAQPSRIMVLAIDNAGTVELAWCNYNGSSILDEATVISTTAEGGAGAADSANVIYSTTARTSVPFRILGYFESTQAIAGTWATSPTVIQGPTGSALKSIQGILGTVTATTSGTSIDYTGIPSWVRRITLMFNGVSTNGTASILVQIGDAGGIETTGYLGTGTALGAPSTVSPANFTTGFGFPSSSASNIMHGTLVLSLLDPANGIWVATGILGLSSSANQLMTGGSKPLSPGPLDRVRFTTGNGTDTFDAGSVNIYYE